MRITNNEYPCENRLEKDRKCKAKQDTGRVSFAIKQELNNKTKNKDYNIFD